MNRYKMIDDIIKAEKITDERVKDAMRLCYFRGLSHSNNKKEIIARELKETLGMGWK